METAVKRKVTVRLQHDNEGSSSRPPPMFRSRPPSPTKFTQSDPLLSVPRSRPPSPSKLFTQSDPSLSVPRPKAKVNSVASIRKTPSSGSGISSKTSNASGSTYRSGAKTIASPTPRAVSPFKAPPARSGSPFKPVKARATVHDVIGHTTTKSATATPESRQRSLTTVASDTSLRNTGRRHGGSISTASMVSIRPQTPSALGPSDTSISPQDGCDSSQVGAGPIKVKSKVTGMVKYNVSSSRLPSPPSNTSRTLSPRTRAPSISSNTSFLSTTSSSPDQNTFYPITTATAAANPHRFATRASPPSTARHYYQPFPPKDDLFISYGKQTVAPKVDPTTIPLPPHSPPTSAVSFSSQSSRSRSSVSYHAENSGDSQSSFPTLGSPATHIFGPRSNLPKGGLETEDDISPGKHNDRESDPGLDGEERKIKAEAKSNRKIADLEITNRSLLAINASLEASKHRQAKEIRELRRKLRESRLILPPRAYQVVNVSLDHNESEADEDEDDEDDEEDPRGQTGDESYRRITAMLERLIKTGKGALETKLEDFPEGGAKVLSAEEVRSWRDSSGDSEARTKDEISVDRPPTPSHIAVPQSDDEFLSEEEVEAMTLGTDSASSSPAPPPIHITAS